MYNEMPSITINAIPLLIIILDLNCIFPQATYKIQKEKMMTGSLRHQ